MTIWLPSLLIFLIGLWIGFALGHNKGFKEAIKFGKQLNKKGEDFETRKLK